MTKSTECVVNFDEGLLDMMIRDSESKTGKFQLSRFRLLGFILLTLILAACGGTTVAEAPAAVSQLITPLEYVDEFGDLSDHLLIDVRTPEEYESGHIEGAINIPVEELPQRMDEVPDGLPIVVYCRSGNRSATAAEILTGAGYSLVYDMGGIIDWIAAGLPTR